MAKYKIHYIKSDPTKTGREKKSATVVDEQGVVTKFVTVWPNFPDYANLSEGMIIEAKLDIVQNGQYTNKTLNPISPVESNGGGGYNRSFTRSTGGSKAEIEAIRNEHIKKNMEWKAEGQAYGNSVTNAVNLTIELIRKDIIDGTNIQLIKNSIVVFRDLLLVESQKYQEKGLTPEQKQEKSVESGEIPF